MRMEKDALVQPTIQPATTLTEVELSRLSDFFSILIKIDRHVWKEAKYAEQNCTNISR